MLIEKTLFGEVDKVAKAVERVRDAYKFSQSLGLGKLYVAFSGGKDSICLHRVVEMAAQKDGVDFHEYAEVHYRVTGVDPPELVYFIREHYPHVHRNLYERSMWELIEHKKMPPTKIMRYCCAELKERGGDGRFCATGIRWAESTRRRTRGEFEDIGNTRATGKILFNDNDEDRRQMEHCLPKKQYVVNPIIDWEDEDVWEFIKQENMPYCKLYDQGFTRLGCIGCPMAGGKGQRLQFEKFPKFRASYIRAFERMIENRRKSGLPTKWETGEEVMEWWLNDSLSVDADQLELDLKDNL